jgi:bifunctional ADP-heptose synthase (sugar kinase/adenylyltransferase)
LHEVRKLDIYIVRDGIQKSEIRKIRARATTSYSRFLAVNEQVLRIEETYGIQDRWTPMSPEYQDALITMNERRYRRAVDSLERLVVQRLLELTKLGMSGVGKGLLPA